MLCSSDGVSSGSIDDEASMLCSSVKIYIINAHTGPAHYLEPAFGGLEDLSSHLGRAPHYERIAGGDPCAEIFL